MKSSDRARLPRDSWGSGEQPQLNETAWPMSQASSIGLPPLSATTICGRAYARSAAASGWLPPFFFLGVVVVIVVALHRWGHARSRLRQPFR